jgi:hypothetical protein
MSENHGEYLIPPNESDRQKYFLAAVEELDTLDLDAADIRAQKKDIRKRLNANGFSLAAFDLARKMINLPSADVRLFYGQLGEMAEWAGKPLGYQGDLFDAQVDLTESGEMTVSWQGKKAALQGAPRDQNPHTPGRTGYALWDSGWLEGAKLLETHPRPARRPPGRPKGSRDATPRVRRSTRPGVSQSGNGAASGAGAPPEGEETHYPHAHPEPDPSVAA